MKEKFRSGGYFDKMSYANVVYRYKANQQQESKLSVYMAKIMLVEVTFHNKRTNNIAKKVNIIAASNILVFPFVCLKEIILTLTLDFLSHLVLCI